MIAAFSPGSDFKRYLRGHMPRLAFVVILLMPLMYGALYLWAFWNPFADVNKLPVAIVNLDEGATFMGRDVTAGSEVVSGLLTSGQLNLTETTDDEARAGLSDGEYDFTITIPADFSASIVSAAGGDPHSAELIFTFDEKNNYLASIIGQDAAQQVIVQVSDQVGEQVFDAVVEGIKGVIPRLTQAVGQIDELNAGMQQANTGAQELATNLVTAKDGSATLASAIDEIVARLDGGIAEVEGLAASTGLTPAELQQTADRVRVGLEGTTALLDRVVVVPTEAATQLDGLIAELRRAGLNDFANRLQALRDEVASSPTVEEVTAVVDTVRTDADRLNAQLSDPGSALNVALRALSDGTISRDIATAQGAAQQLKNGADQLSTGLVELSNGANELAAGTPRLAAGTAELDEAANQALKLLPDWNNAQQQGFVQALAEPVKLVEHTENAAKTFGYGFAPFFFGLALFVGSLIAWMLFSPLQARPLAQGLGPVRTVLASFAPTLLVGVTQATILYLVLYFGLKLIPVYPVPTLLFLWLMVAMFLAMIQMLNALFGAAVGRVITLAFLMVMLTSAGGIYPVPTTSKPFQVIHPVDPMTYTVTGLRQLIMGDPDHRLPLSILVLTGLTLVFLALSAAAARRNRQYNMDRLYPPVEV